MVSTTGVSDVVGAETGVVDMVGWTGDDEVVDETIAATVEPTVPDEPKLLDASVEVPPLTVTSLTITTSPSTLVILTSTIVVPNPLEFSKKLYVWRVVVCQVLPPSVLTSRLATALFALTTCMLNQ